MRISDWSSDVCSSDLIKALLTVPGVARGIDAGALQDYLAFGYSGNDQTLFAGIRKLPPASLLVCENGSYRIERYWEIPAEADDAPSEADWEERLRAAMESRSDERRVGKAGDSTCRSRWSPSQ